MRPTKLLALMTDAFGDEGGIARYNRDLISAANGISQLHSIAILTRHRKKKLVNLPSKTVQLSGSRGKIGYAIRALFAALTDRPSVLFCGHANMAWIAAIISRLVGAKLIIQTHGIDAWDEPSSIQRWAFEVADCIFAVSRFTRARVLEWADIAPERINVLPNTISGDYTPGDRRSTRACFGLNDEFVLLSVSRLDKRESYKGIDRIITLLSKLKTENRELVYLIAGEGNDLPRLEALARDHDVAKQVRLLDRVPQEHLPNLYRAADLFVLPSTGEGFGIVFLEAMACGTRALGLATGGAIDALGDGALGTAVSDASFDDTLKRLVRSPTPETSSLSTRTISRFGWSRFDMLAKTLLSRLMSKSNILEENT